MRFLLVSMFFSICLQSSLSQAGGGGDGGWGSYNTLTESLFKSGVRCNGISSGSPKFYLDECQDSTSKFSIKSFHEYYSSDEQLVGLEVTNITLQSLSVYYVKNDFVCSQTNSGAQCIRSSTSTRVVLTVTTAQSITIEQFHIF